MYVKTVRHFHIYIYKAHMSFSECHSGPVEEGHQRRNRNFLLELSNQTKEKKGRGEGGERERVQSYFKDAMGLAGFYALLTKQGYVPKNLRLAALRGKTVAIDGDFVLYKSLLGHTKGNAITPKDIARPIQTWLTRAKHAGITTIFVTTGGPAPLEKQTHCALVRKRKRERQEERIKMLVESLPALEDIGEELHAREKICRLKNSVRRVTPAMSRQVVHLLQSDGHHCVQAKSEADFMLVLLSEDKKCHYVATDDADIIVAGASHVLRGFVRLLMDPSTPARDFCRADILACLSLSSDTLLHLGSLMSCDYLPSLPNVGPMTAFRMMQKYGSVSKFIHSDCFSALTSNKKKRKFSLPADMTPETYLEASARTMEIFRSRPDKGNIPIGAGGSS